MKGKIDKTVARTIETMTFQLDNPCNSSLSNKGDPSLPTIPKLRNGFIPEGVETIPKWVAPTSYHFDCCLNFPLPSPCLPVRATPIC